MKSVWFRAGVQSRRIWFSVSGWLFCLARIWRLARTVVESGQQRGKISVLAATVRPWASGLMRRDLCVGKPWGRFIAHRLLFHSSGDTAELLDMFNWNINSFCFLGWRISQLLTWKKFGLIRNVGVCSSDWTFFDITHDMSQKCRCKWRLLDTSDEKEKKPG